MAAVWWRIIPGLQNNETGAVYATDGESARRIAESVGLTGDAEECAAVPRLPDVWTEWNAGHRDSRDGWVYAYCRCGALIDINDRCAKLAEWEPPPDGVEGPDDDRDFIVHATVAHRCGQCTKPDGWGT